jgi:hypothetical protein
MGRKIGMRELRQISECFDEKIDDLRLCQAILVLAMKKENALARGAFGRAIKTGVCGYGDGKRAAQKLIREARRRLGYKYTFQEKRQRLWRKLTGVSLREIIRETHDVLHALFRFFFSGER